jgi:D-lactate dehydrogenase (cytochrome)
MKMIAMGGTCTGEHGIGSGKIDALIAETGAPAVNIMKSIKHALDPNNILNPGKVFN